MIHLGGTAKAHDDLERNLVPIDSVRQHPDNYNNGDVDSIMESIMVNGVYRPVFVQDSTGYIIAGNHTWQACKELGAEQIPIVRLAVDETAALKIMVADNRTASLAMPDNALLLDLLNRVDSAETLIGTGYKDHDLEVLTELAKIAAESSSDIASWPTISAQVHPRVKKAYMHMTREADTDAERIELLLRLAGWDGSS